MACLFHFNDVYEVSERAAEPVGGAARFGTALTQRRQEAAARCTGPLPSGAVQSLVLFGGDVFNPSSLSGITRGEHMIDVLNTLQVDVAVVGNHDLDFGEATLAAYMKRCHFPWLLSNVTHKGKDQLLAEAQRYAFFDVVQGKDSEEKDGEGKDGEKDCTVMRVGVVGLVEKEWLATIPSLPPIDYEDFVACGTRLAQELRSTHKCDIVIALVHMRVPNTERCAREIPGVDLVLGGHDHIYYSTVVNDVPCLISGSDFRQFSEIHATPRADGPTPKGDISGGEATHNFEIARFDVMSTLYKPADDMLQVIRAVEAKAEVLKRKVIGWSSVRLDCRVATVRMGESNFGNLLCDLVRRELGTDFCLINGGTLRSDSMYGPGPFTIGDLKQILPFDDPMVVVEITGAQLREAVECAIAKWPLHEGRFPQQSGLRFTFDPEREPMSRLVRLVEADTNVPVDDKKVYTLACKYYIAQGHDGYTILKECPRLVDVELAQMLSVFLRNYCSKLHTLNGFVEESSSSGASTGGNSATTSSTAAVASSAGGSVSVSTGSEEPMSLSASTGSVTRPPASASEDGAMTLKVGEAFERLEGGDHSEAVLETLLPMREGAVKWHSRASMSRSCSVGGALNEVGDAADVHKRTKMAERAQKKNCPVFTMSPTVDGRIRVKASKEDIHRARSQAGGAGNSGRTSKDQSKASSAEPSSSSSSSSPSTSINVSKEGKGADESDSEDDSSFDEDDLSTDGDDDSSIDGEEDEDTADKEGKKRVKVRKRTKKRRKEHVDLAHLNRRQLLRMIRALRHENRRLRAAVPGGNPTEADEAAYCAAQQKANHHDH